MVDSTDIASLDIFPTRHYHTSIDQAMSTRIEPNRARPVKVDFIVSEGDRYITSPVPLEIVSRIFDAAKSNGNFQSIARLMQASDKYWAIGQDRVFKHLEITRATTSTTALADLLFPKCTSTDYDEAKYPTHTGYRAMVEEITLDDVPETFALRYWNRQATSLLKAARFNAWLAEPHAAPRPWAQHTCWIGHDDADHDQHTGDAGEDARPELERVEPRSNPLFPNLRRANLSARFLSETAQHVAWQGLHKDDEYNDAEWTKRQELSVIELLSSLGGDLVELCVDMDRTYTLAGLEKWLSQQMSPIDREDLRVDIPSICATVAADMFPQLEIWGGQYRSCSARFANCDLFGSLGIRNYRGTKVIPKQFISSRPLHLRFTPDYDAKANHTTILADKVSWDAMLENLTKQMDIWEFELPEDEVKVYPDLLVLHSPPTAIQQIVADSRFDPVRELIAIEGVVDECSVKGA